MPRKVYKKRSYKKRVYKGRRYKRRYYKRKFYRKSTIKRPEIHISKNNVLFLGPNTNPNQNGTFVNITTIGGSNASNSDDIKFTLNGAEIQGRKIILKYLYIKGYLNSTTVEDDINGKLYIFRRKRNVKNNVMDWPTLLDMPFNLSSPSSWTAENVRDILYCYDWKNDINGQIKHYVKKIYAKYDNTNNIIPFKIRVPLYDCVLTCDSVYDTSGGFFTPQTDASTNGLYLSFITTSNLNDTSVQLKLKYKIYYTDY